MSDRDRKRLREIHTFPALVKYLREDLGWPVEQDNFANLDEITFDWEADELGIDPDQAAKIDYIKQLRPLENGEPQGVFFVKFNAKSLPVVALRRLLSKLVIRKRATATAAERPLWAMRDLVFISSYGSSEERQLSFAYFQESAQKTELPTLKVLGWDDRDTALHLDRVHDLLTSHLTWPANTKSLPVWRKAWSKAFELRHGQVVSTAKELAEQLATLARGIRERANQLLKLETEKGPLRTLMAGFKAALIHDLTEDQFADMYAQTIAYGLLSARITHPDPVNAETLPDLIPVTNPFLKELMETFVVAGGKHRGSKRGLNIDFDELGIGDVVELLRRANMDAVLRNFGAGDRKEDPVTYFYEDFLNAYDAKERKRRGVYYTPKPVVSYIVRSVHEILQTEFGIKDGLASTVTWGEMSRRSKEVTIPKGVSAESPFLQILDPATGTATFLVTVIDVIFETLSARWQKEGLSETQRSDAWNAYVPEDLLPRLYGYELMMAPYAIAHLKIGLKLFETGYKFGSHERARIYLTNALEPATNASYSQIDALSEALAHEAQAVDDVKRTRRFAVVLGNPPYSVSSANSGIWIVDLVAMYKKSVRHERNIQPLSDDYIKFVSLAHNMVRQSQLGIVGLITNHSWLSGLIHRGMRQAVLADFDRLSIVDLHGSALLGLQAPDGSKDENVFDIQQGVAITIARRSSNILDPNAIRTVSVTQLWGDRDSKYAELLKRDALEKRWTVLIPDQPNFFFVPMRVNDARYDSWTSLTSIFEMHATGFVTGKDEVLISFKKDALLGLCEALHDRTISDSAIATRFGLDDTNGWPVRARRAALTRLPLATLKSYIRTITYRPFDIRFALYCDFLQRARLETMQHMLRPNLGLVATRMIKGEVPAHWYVARTPIEKILLSPKTSNNAVLFPLYVWNPEPDLATSAETKNANISRTLISRLLTAIGGAEGSSHFDTLPEDIFQYAYAVFYSNAYRTEYADFLKIDYPRLPLPASRELFQKLGDLGGALVSLHLMESSKLDALSTTYTGPKNPEVGRVGWSHDTVWLDAEVTKRGGEATAGTSGFQGVSEVVWNFHIGGYQVCEKWLKDRKGRKLLKDDIEHYQKIIVALSETIRIMREIDEVIERYGGWPGAFQTGAPSEAPTVNPGHQGTLI